MTELDLATPVELPGGVTPSPPPEGFGQGLADFGQAVHAAYKAERFDGDMFGRQNALSDAADRRNWEIQRSTGVQLENPLEGGYAREARDRLMSGGVTGHIQDVQLQIHQEKLDALHAQFPDHADTIGAHRPLLADAKQLADYWQQRAARGEPGLNAVAGVAASFIGGMGGFLRSPLNAASLLIGGGEVKATSVALRIAEGALRQGAVNAGLQAIAEPGVQAWRAERRQEAGLGAALKDIGAAALFGAVPGAGIEAAKIAAPHVRALMRGAEADAAVFAEPPAAKGLQETLDQALRHGEGASEALPEFPAADVDRKFLPADLPDVRIVEHSSLGPAFAGFEGKWAEAVAHLREIETGDARGVLTHPGIAEPIDVIWGSAPSARSEGLGLAKIIAKHPEVVDDLPERLAEMTVESRSANRIILSSDRTRAVVRLDYDGRDKHWMMTAYEKERPASSKVDSRSDAFEADPSSAYRQETRYDSLPLARPSEDIGADRPLVKREPDAASAIRPGDDVFAAADRLRRSSAEIDRALASDAPDIRAAGRLATLGDAAFEEARSGRVDLDVALATAARVSNEAEQLAVMRGASLERPLNAEEAAAAVTREMETRATPIALAAIRGADEAGSAVPAPKYERDIAKGADKQIEALTTELEREAPIVVVAPKRPVTRANPSLFEALAGGGGLSPHSELAAIFDGNPFVPGFGRLVREGGMNLEDALRNAKELGYLHDAADRAEGELTVDVNQLLDRLRDEANGSRVYRIGHEPPSKELAAQAADMKARHRDALKELKAVPELQPSDGWKPSKDILDRAAALMAEDDRLPPLAAWDRAAVAYERELRALKDQFEPVQKGRVDEFGEIPGWDIPAEIRTDERAAPQGRGAPAGAREGTAGEGGAAGGAGAEIGGDGGSHRPLSSERTAAGEQTLVPGVEPVTDRQRAEARATKPLRGGDAPPPAGGLFDENARAQTDLLDLVPSEDGRALTREELLKTPTRAELIAGVVSRCPF